VINEGQEEIIKTLQRIEKIAADILAALTPVNVMNVTAERHVGQVLGALDEPPVGTVLQDRDGDRWTHTPRGWTITGKYMSPWRDVKYHAPFTVIELGEEKPS